MPRTAYRCLAAISVCLAAGAAAAGTRPRYGGTLRVSIQGTLAALDPADSTISPVEDRLAPLVFETLVRIDGAGQPRPLLGERISATLDVTLTRRGSAWAVTAWREVAP